MTACKLLQMHMSCCTINNLPVLWCRLRHRHSTLCCYSSTSTSSRSNAAHSTQPSQGQQRRRRQRQEQEQQQEQQQEQPQDQLLQEQQPEQPQQEQFRVALGTPSIGLAKALCRQLQTLGTAEVWASSAANHFTAMQALAEAHSMLWESSEQQGLATTASLSPSDQAVADDQKRSLKKLTLHIRIAEPVDPSLWEAGATNHISTNRTQNIGQVIELLQQLMGEPGSGGAAVIEMRGEQAMTKAIKATLSLQAFWGAQVLLQPWRGDVVDVVAEKRGEQRLAGGLLLLLTWAP
jgi:hypothetical protein